VTYGCPRSAASLMIVQAGGNWVRIGKALWWLANLEIFGIRSTKFCQPKLSDYANVMLVLRVWWR